jgi:hypothetical protein
MLVPGEYLTYPNPPEKKRPPNSPRVELGLSSETRPTAPTAVREEPEPRSFLLILLQALGTVHT